MSVYDVDRFDCRPDPDLICCICHCVLDKPLESPCQHVFCKVCIETWLKNHHSCPSCRKRLRESKLKPALPIIKNMINRLIMKCENSDTGCKTKMAVEHYKVHIESCDFVHIKCMNTGCTKEVIRKDMYCHEKECNYRLVPCKRGCGLPVAAKDANSHMCVEELKNRLQKLEDSFENYKKDSEMRLIQLENMVADLQNRAQQDSSTSDVDQDDDNSRDAPDEDANDPDSDDDDDYQSDREAGSDSGDDDDDDNGSNNEEDYDQDSEGGNSGQSYESSNNSIDWASDGSSSLPDFVYPEFDDAEEDGDSNESTSVEEINLPTDQLTHTTTVTIPPPFRPPPPTPRPPPPPAPHTTYILSPPARPAATINPYVSTVQHTSPPSALLHHSIKSYVQPPIQAHTTLNRVNTPLPPPPPYRPTASSVPTLNVISVSTSPTSTTGVVGVVSSRPSTSVAMSTSRPGLKMQLSLQIISRSQATPTVSSASVRPTILNVTKPSTVVTLPVRLSPPVANPNTSSAPITANRPTFNFATVTSSHSATMCAQSQPTNYRASTSTTLPILPTVLPQAASHAAVRAALRPLSVGSGSVIASRIPGTRRRNIQSRRHRRRSNTLAPTSTNRSHPVRQKPTVPLVSSSASSSSSNPSSSLQVPTESQAVSSSQPGGTDLSRPSASKSVSNAICVITPDRAAQPVSSTAVSSCRCAPTPGCPINSTVQCPGESVTSASMNSGIEPLTRSLKRSHNDDSSSSDESERTQQPQTTKHVCLQKITDGV